jgi:hypothetical protein
VVVQARIALWVALVLAAAAPAGAVSFPLTVEFDDGLVGTYGSVDVIESGGDLQFTVTLDPSLGADRDLHELYFNLADGFTGVAISSTDVVNTAYTLSANPSVAGGAGSSFDFGVNFGNGAGGPGNGRLTTATFTLSAAEALTLADLAITSSTSQGIESIFAVHVQGTALVAGATSETVGAPIPEPTTAALVVAGLSGLAAFGRRRSAAAAE